MMLYERDLMVGDIVMYQDKELCTIRDGADIDIAYEDCYSDISLNSETLDKLGFKSIYDDCSCYRMKGPFLENDDRLEYDITIDLEQPNCSYISHNIISKSSRRSLMTYHGPIVSLHQLQHLLRDCDLGEIADGFYDKLKADGLCTEKHV